MADTIQIVQWTLEMGCQLRQDDDALVCPEAARNSVWSARAYSKALRESSNRFGVYGDIYVTSCTFGHRPGDRKISKAPHYPCDGFIISKEFEAYGGTDALNEMCSGCPANARPQELAGCVGTVPQWPDSPDTQEQLIRIIERLGLEHDVANAFPKTTPIWYGLWAVSPVPYASLEVLRTLLSEMLEEDMAEMVSHGSRERDHIDQFHAVLSAIDIAQSRHVNLHVTLLPLGHTDLGLYTVFPHCPFCKARAKVPRWQREYPLEHHVCHVCGTKYSPQETCSSEKMKRDRDCLRALLGQTQFEEFAETYLIANGESPETAAEVVRESEAWERQRQEKLRRDQELNELRQRYLEQHVFQGLDCLPVPRSELEDDEQDEVKDDRCTKWFDADNLAIVLQRCKQLGIRVTMLQHVSVNSDQDRFEMRKLSSPEQLLSKWVAEGCRESFHAVCVVPDSLIT